jgi:CRISPR/Cas system-associated endoribonuclease Cas2
MPSRRACLRTAALAVALQLAGCAVLDAPTTVRLTQADIEQLVERNFPIDRALLEVYDVTVNAPKLRLVPERNRLVAVVDVRARDRLFSSTWQGQLSFDAALRWEPRDQTLRLTQVRVQDLALAKPGTLNRSTVERLGAALAERVMEDSSIYRLSAERAAQLRKLGVEPGAVTVTSRGVEITFAPAPAR